MTKQPFTVPLLVHASDKTAYINMQGGRVGKMPSIIHATVFHLLAHGNKNK
jgi:hypothetical protein